MAAQITTDHKWKQFRYRDEVPAKVLAADFDYQNADDALDGFFKYRGHWYHLDQFMRAPKTPDFAGWQGYLSDSFYSGVLLEVSKDGEEYRVATFIA